MSISFGDKEIDDIKYGDRQVVEVRLGDTLVWEMNKIIYLGNATSFNVKNLYRRYNELTASNFMFLSFDAVRSTDYVKVQGYTQYLNVYSGYQKSYNASTGALSAYSRGDSTGNARMVMVSDPSKLTYLGSGSTFDLSNIEGYQDFTVDNFYISSTKTYGSPFWDYHSSRTYDGSWSAQEYFGLVKSYNANTGILTCYTRIYNTAASGTSDNWDQSLSTSVYLDKKRRT